MNIHSNFSRLVATGLLASAVLALASPAFADGGRRRYKGVQSYNPVQRVYVREHSSSAAPVLAGLIGGFILGAAVTSNAHSVVVHERPYYHRTVQYRYYDPYGDDWYDSLDQCEFRHGGPRVVFVVDVRSGHRLRTLRYHEGRWNRCEDGAYDRYSRYDFGGRYDDQRYNDTRYDDEGDDR